MITSAAVVPHPPIILPAIGKGEEKKIADIDAAYKEAARTINQDQPETLVIITPHGPSYLDYIQLSKGKKMTGDLRQFGDREDHFLVDNDLELVSEIERLADKAGLPVGTLGRQDGILDHGTMIPLYYFQPKRIIRISAGGPGTRIHYELGKLVRQAAENLDRRIAIVSSSDLSHCQKAGTHYGFKACGPEYDKAFMEIVKDADFKRLLATPDSKAEEAMVCGQKPMAVLAGALDGFKPEAKALAHSAEFGVGYGVGTFTNLQPDESRKLDTTAKSEDKDPLVKAARKTIESFIKNRTIPHIELEDDTPAACFVSIHEGGNLRGCIGTTEPTRNTFTEELQANAISAATRDPRFPAIQAWELPDLEISVDVLKTPEPIKSERELDPKKYGVIVENGHRRGLLLPDLEGVDTVKQQVSIAKQKAGIQEQEPVKLYRFEVVRHA